MPSIRAFAVGVVVPCTVALAACDSRPSAVEPEEAPPAVFANGGAAVFAKGGAAACPTPADVVVTDEASLFAALAAASPGDVIGLDGMIELTTDRALVATDDLTLTCATPGSGLFGTGGLATVILVGSPPTTLIEVRGDRVAVEGLSLDGRQVVTAYIAEADDPSFSYNSVRVRGGGVGSWFNRTRRPSATRNSYDASDPGGAFSAIQIQQGTFQALVERNTVVGSGTTGIRIRSGVGHRVRHNTVDGAWRHSMLVIPWTGTEISSNRLQGAADFGLVVGGQFPGSFLATGNLVRSNRITGAGQAGVFVQRACGNTFLGNDLNGNAGDVGLVFDATTGANTYRGNPGVVVDHGDFDCDGDGVPDPNRVSGG